MKSEIIKKITYARAGLLGNPSDGFNGKTISIPIKNFQAEIMLWPSENLIFILNNEDQDEYEKISDMVDYVGCNGYYGGIRLIKAAIVVFIKFCRANKITLSNCNFTISYRSSIPRQSGLAGSSAIIISTIRALMEFFCVDEKVIPPQVLANVALSAESEELGITAGLQDRVVQSYGVPVYMDFSREAFKSNGNIHGKYVALDKNIYQLPQFLIAWNNRPSESGKVHSDVKARFLAGDKGVIATMDKFASIAEEGYFALKNKDIKKLHGLMNANFDLRRKLFGDKVVGSDNIKMIELARSCDAAAKFPGSGGAIIIMPKKNSDINKIIDEFNNHRYFIERVIL